MSVKRPALLPLLIGFLAAWLLSGCQPVRAPDSTWTPTPTLAVPATTPGSATRAATSASRGTVAATTSVPTMMPSPTTARTALPLPTVSPSPAPTVTQTPVPTLPPPAPAVDGDPLAISLGWRLDANGHLTAATIDLSGAQPQISLASLGRRVYGLNSGGGVRWQASTRGPVYALAQLADGQLATGDDAGTITILDSHGRPVWKVELGSRVTALHTAPGAGLLAGGWDERLSLFDSEGQVQWQVKVGAPVSSITDLWGAGAEQVLVATLDGRARAYDLQGRELWRFDAGSALTSMGTVLANGQTLVLLGAQDGRLLALDSSGALRWQRTLGTGAPVWHAAARLDGELPGVVTGTGGTSPALVLLSAATGQVRWCIRLPAAARAVTSLDLDGDGGLEILAGLADGQVQAHDPQGRLRGAVHAGLSVWGLYPLGQGSAIILADVVAWQLAGQPGPAGGPWLPAPATLPATATLPAAAAFAPSPGQGEVDGGILVFLGDVSFGRSMEAQLARYGAAHPWQGLGPVLHGEDLQVLQEGQRLPVLTIVNLECSLTTQGEPLDKSYLIRAHPLWARSLAAGGIDLVTLANNHALDFGPLGLKETVETLRALGIETVGAGASAEAAHQPAFFDLGGVRVAFLGYAAARWDGSADVPVTDLLAWARPDNIAADVNAARDQADFVVVLLHAGTEYATSPSADQIAAAHAAIDAGADLVVGHHPHVTQTVERYRQGLIVYSLGDAVFDIPRASAMRGHLLRVHVTGSGLAGAELWPFWIEEAIQPRLLNSGQGTPLVESIYP
jgi:poly-gamma-glutamate capsule biosynthesis protein CapA/YwtB (metallophosphatase superfamily)/outer membrane protein assembly factor BamB